MGTPLVQAEQNGSISVDNLSEVVMRRMARRLTKQRLVPSDALPHVAYADNGPRSLHRILLCERSLRSPLSFTSLPQKSTESFQRLTLAFASSLLPLVITQWNMTARQIRRAAERKARKEERKDEGALSERAEDCKRESNRANAQLSTGPRTKAGKAASSQNALKTALTGRTVLLPADDRTRYEQHLTHYFALWNPVGEHECTLVQLLADAWWRLLRIPHLEAAIYAKGRMELTDVTELAPDSKFTSDTKSNCAICSSKERRPSRITPLA